MTNTISDIQHLETHRSAITGHCYRMLGSFFDAEDATQEAMIRAWKGIDRFDGRASLKNWLYRIATNVCLDEIHNKGRRARPMEEGSAFSGTPSVKDLVQRPANTWIEPISDARALPSDSDPSERAILKQSIRLAFVAALAKARAETACRASVDGRTGIFGRRGSRNTRYIGGVRQQRTTTGPCDTF